MKQIILLVFLLLSSVVYAVANDKRIPKSKSESYWDSEQGKYIELDTKYY